MTDSDLIWTVRAYIYNHFADTARAPGAEDVARHFGLDLEQAGQALRALHDKHALFLEGDTLNIRIANPFSAVPTQFQVEVDGRTYWANCAWDSLGIPAALQTSEAVIRSACAYTGEPLELSLRQGRLISAGEVIHFLVPFQRWYEDMVFT